MKSSIQILLLEKQQTLSKPAPGRTMLSLLKKHGTELHNAHTMLTSELHGLLSRSFKDNWINEHIYFKFNDSDITLLNNKKANLIGSSILLNWICGNVLNKLSEEADLHDAELWFNNSTKVDTFANYISPLSHRNVLSHLKKINFHSLLEELPYLTEVFDTGNEVASKTGSGRKRKKSNGIYYTPTDIIDFIVSRSFKNSAFNCLSIEDSTWFDPALGTGSFLLSVLKKAATDGELLDKKQIEGFCTRNLFGTDISPIALQSAAYIIATSCLYYTGNENLKELTKLLRNNLVLIDSTTITSKDKLWRVFPDIGRDGVDFIISNPPYSKRKKTHSTLFSEEEIFTNTSNDSLYPCFVRQLIDLTKDSNGGGGMVVPLSLVASSKQNFRNLRKYIQRQHRVSEFWNFDRTPDSLFGDDVKTRNTIFFFRKGTALIEEGGISTSYLHRWNSRNRENLFKSITITNLPSNIDITEGVPKVGDEFGIILLQGIMKRNSGKLLDVLETTKSKPEIITKTTAYNWIPIELNKDKGTPVSTGRVFWRMKSKEFSPLLVYAAMNSRITYWLWRVWGDGFHLTTKFMSNLPYGREFFTELDSYRFKDLGLDLWNNVQKDLVITNNAGVVSYSYCPLFSTKILDEIDTIVVSIFKLPCETIEYLKSNMNSLISAGRENEAVKELKMKY